ncbi:hypothetical protein [uncultured Gelidibacter sp.]|uniref:hypothetical protein n=1 Tax=uncultured Gelidibacter sp. TaxID=259318 RepID=UPI0026218454|nr:hypothetical protein [uncultured Gelidibacter sp.]
MKIFICILTVLTLNSCSRFGENGIEVAIENNSNTPITDVQFTTSEKLDVIKRTNIDPKETATDFLSMTKNQSDGAYFLTFTRANGKKEKIGGGYYTNGGALDRWVQFDIRTDTTLVTFSGSGY